MNGSHINLTIQCDAFKHLNQHFAIAHALVVFSHTKEKNILEMIRLTVSPVSPVVLSLSLCSVESTALRLITALGSSEVQPQFTRFLNDPKTVLSAESEELNRALILTLARATHVTGSTQTGFTCLDFSVLQVVVAPSLFPLLFSLMLCYLFQSVLFKCD